MNTTNILLGTTSLLIVVAFALSFGGFSKGRETSDSQAELAKLKDEMTKMKDETRALELSQLRATRSVYPIPPATPPAPLPMTPGPVATESGLAENERIELEQQIADLQEVNDGLAQENEEAFAEETEESIKQRMAVKRIQMAMNMGSVVSASKENALVIYMPTSSAPNFQPGKVLAIRRNTGIVGTIEIDRLDPSGQYIATMRPHGYSPDGYPDIQPGDVVIIDPNT